MSRVSHDIISIWPNYTEIRGIPFQSPPFEVRSCEVAIHISLNHGFRYIHAKLENHTFLRNVWSVVPSSATSFPANCSETPGKKSVAKPIYN